MKHSQSATLVAHHAFNVSVEASFTKGLPNFTIVGLASSAIQESKERVKSALHFINFSFPPLRITLNLSPSDLQKDGTHFDLPIALMIALQKSSVDLSGWAIFGELGLDGSIKSTDGMFALILSYAMQNPNARILVPLSIAPSLAVIPRITIFGASNLQEAIDFLEERISIAPTPPSKLMAKVHTLHGNDFYHPISTHAHEDFADVRGQNVAKRAALIAAAGNHNLLLEGNPGSGKSMIAKRIPTIMAPLSHEELLTVAKLHALEGKSARFDAVRPFRSPHHTATAASIFGGGSSKSRIGEVGLAHLGVLFFDELPHFGKPILEALREPLEDRRINIARVNTKITYETNFMFVAAMNPCPCGNLLSTTQVCRCTQLEITRYRNRLSDPFLDRIDLYVTMQESRPQDKSETNSQVMQEAVLRAFEVRQARGQREPNANLNAHDVGRFCAIDAEGESLLLQASQRYGLTARSLDKIIKVARTIADIEKHDQIQKSDLLEALSYRRRAST
ncbi:MAG: Fis family transcriptional regulator [Sulfuricurvum sp. PC08-66]|nr:MAG: Fis family transcriptional regulator [Sulfuricurvum sp. PC08-66]